MTKALDLYAKIEPLIGFYDEYDELYSLYLQLLSSLNVHSILDIGCGNGKLLKILDKNGYKSFGIDRSKEMIRIAKHLGVNAEAKELSSLDTNTYDCALAVGDVLNYMKDDELNNFFDGVKEVITNKGYFIADINTEAGFEVADGVMVKSNQNSFLSVEANYKDNILTTDITFFEKEKENFKKLSGEVLQYFHPHDRFKKLESFRLVSSQAISMFSNEDEKILMLFQAT